MKTTYRRRTRSTAVQVSFLLVGALVLSAFWAGAASAATICNVNCTVWNPSTQPTGQSVFNDSKTVELGLEFHSDLAGTVTGVRFWKDVSETGTHVGHLWDASGNMLAEVTVTETASGWQQATFPTPVTISAGTNYWISEFTADGTYVATVNWPYPADNSPLHGTAAAFHYFGGFPDSPSLNNANYWVDVVFQPAPADLAITNHAPGLLLLGDRLTNTLGVTNGGPGTATNVTVTNPVPSGSNYVSAVASQGTCSPAGGTVTCQLGSLAPGAAATVTIKTDPKLLGNVKDTATVGADELDSTPRDNTATSSTLVLLSL